MPIILDGTAGLTNNATDLNYTGTLTGGAGVVNLGAGQVFKDASGVYPLLKKIEAQAKEPESMVVEGTD